MGAYKQIDIIMKETGMSKKESIELYLKERGIKDVKSRMC